MEDHFECLGLPRRPWLDPDTVKDRFLQLSAENHPDHHGGLGADARQAKERAFAQVNQAQQALSSTRDRLVHLLELESPPATAKSQAVPPAIADLFAPVGEALRRADAALREKGATMSPILKAAAYARSLETVDQLMGLQAMLRSKTGQLEAEIQSLDLPWDQPGSPKPLARLAEVAAELGYYDRWLGQIQAKINELSF